MKSLRVLISIMLYAFVVNFASAQTYDKDYTFDHQLVNAADLGNEYEISKLLKTGVSPNSKGLYNTTPLMRASLRGYDDIVRLLIEAGSDVNAKDIGGATALHLAARTGHRKISEMLLKHGASPNVEDNEGYTPIKRAILAQHAGIIEAMIKKGADLDSKGSTGISAREMAKRSKSEQVRAAVHEDMKQIMQQQPLLAIPTEEVVVEPLKSEQNLPEKHLQPAPKEGLKTSKHEEKGIKYEPVKEEKQEQKAEKETALSSISEDEKPKSVITVDEAIKIPVETNLASEDTKIVESKEVPKPVELTKTATPLKSIREISLELTSFDSEENAILFWQKLSEENIIKSKQAKLVIDNTNTKPSYRLRFDGFASASDVFDNCKTIRSKKSEILCYVLHNIY